MVRKAAWITAQRRVAESDGSYDYGRNVDWSNAASDMREAQNSSRSATAKPQGRKMSAFKAGLLQHVIDPEGLNPFVYEATDALDRGDMQGYKDAVRETADLYGQAAKGGVYGALLGTGAAAKGLDMVFRAMMPSTTLKGLAGYFPQFANFATKVSPWADAGLLSWWGAEAGNEAIKATNEGRTLDAIGYGTVAALPFVPATMKGVSKAYNSVRNTLNPFSDASLFSAFDGLGTREGYLNAGFPLKNINAPVTKTAAKVEPYFIQDYGGGYMLPSLMRGNPLEKLADGVVFAESKAGDNEIVSWLNRHTKVKDLVKNFITKRKVIGTKYKEKWPYDSGASVRDSDEAVVDFIENDISARAGIPFSREEYMQTHKVVDKSAFRKGVEGFMTETTGDAYWPQTASGETKVHEVRHQKDPNVFNKDALRGAIASNPQLTQRILGTTSPATLGIHQIPLSEEQYNLLRKAYKLRGKHARVEDVTTNAELRYRIYDLYCRIFDKTPTQYELNNFIDELGRWDMFRLYNDLNGYVRDVDQLLVPISGDRRLKNMKAALKNVPAVAVPVALPFLASHQDFGE